jgi:FkbH-like protein
METIINGNMNGLKETKYIKCVVWDLDNTIWDGVLLEGEEVSLRCDAVDIIKTLDGRGILHSIASKNVFADAMAKLREFGIDDYFLYPQVHWNSKIISIEEIAQQINIGIDSIAFIDDQPYEREEVRYSLPDVLCIDAADLHGVLEMPEMNPRFITEDSKKRRQMYISEMKRKETEDTYVGPKEEFLHTLGMSLTISTAEEIDLQRAEELTVRTNQLNSTGITYSYDELDYFRQSDQHKLLIMSLEDKFGDYGKIGLALIECEESFWTLKLMLMSCRVMSRGVGTIMINYILKLAKKAGVKLRAEFLTNGRNRVMYVTYKLGGFREIERKGDTIMLENDLARIQPFPDYVRIQTLEERFRCPPWEP